jgi:hypothetical protein
MKNLSLDEGVDARLAELTAVSNAPALPALNIAVAVSGMCLRPLVQGRRCLPETDCRSKMILKSSRAMGQKTTE